MPPSVREVIIARFDRLSSDLREAVKHASILGKEFAVNALSMMLLNSRSSTEERLPVLLLEGSDEHVWQRISEIRYIFKHALIRDAIY